jgi:hypothetical protein
MPKNTKKVSNCTITVRFADLNCAATFLETSKKKFPQFKYVPQCETIIIKGPRSFYQDLFILTAQEEYQRRSISIY